MVGSLGALSSKNLGRMKMRKFWLAAVASAAIVGSAIANEPVALMVGPGSYSCQYFVEQYRKDKTAELLFFAWGQGFMSATNFVRFGITHETPIILNAISVDDQLRIMREYCFSHLGSSYREGIMELYTRFPDTMAR